MQALEEALQKSIRSPLFGFSIRAGLAPATTAQFLKQIEGNGPADQTQDGKQQKQGRTKTPSLKLKHKLPSKKSGQASSQSLSRNRSAFLDNNSQMHKKNLLGVSRNDKDIVKKLIMKYNP